MPRVPQIRSLACVLPLVACVIAAGCGWRLLPVTAETELGGADDLGILIGRFDAGPTVGTVDAPPQDPAVHQDIENVSGGGARELPLEPGQLASDFYVVVPAGRYRLTEGDCDTGFPDGHSLRTAEWFDTGVEFDVVAGEVNCVGEVVGTRHRGGGGLLMAVLTRGGASYSFEVRDTCAEIEQRFGDRFPAVSGESQSEQLPPDLGGSTEDFEG